MNLGSFGVWSGALRNGARAAVLDAAAELEQLGYGTIWFPGGQRSCGSHPYFVPPEHTRIARQSLGPSKVVAPEHMVVLEADPTKARAVARPSIDRYLHAPNYTNNLQRLGFSTSDFAEGGSDRLVDAIVAWGTPEKIVERVKEHLVAGADHVCIQVLTETPQDLPMAMNGWRRLAAMFASSS